MQFTGRISFDGELINDRVSGEIHEGQDKSRVQWRGVIQIPVAAGNLMFKSGPFRLDCSDGFSILINLLEMQASNNNLGTRSTFKSKGLPLE